jgi:hypothetical protein
MDESGHDHKHLPYEVRGGVIIHASKLWRFVQQMRANEVFCFGDYLHEYGSELKGSKLLKRKRFRFASQTEPMDDVQRQSLSKQFLRRSAGGDPLTSEMFAAFGQASIEMARRIFDCLAGVDAKVVAGAIPAGARVPDDAEHLLRKDHVFLFERYYYFLEEHQETGLIVLDEVETSYDRKFVRRLERYFDNTQKGRKRRQYVIPAPMFVSSDLSYPVQAADVVIYAINWAFRLPQFGMDADRREEISDEFGWRLADLQYVTERENESGQRFTSYGIFYVPDPFDAR